MKKLFSLVSTIAIAIVTAALFGIIHDQLTYTISYEYYTKFKFIQFGLWESDGEAIFPYPRLAVSAVGVMATWWMGIPIGLILGLIGLKKPDWKITFQTFLVVLVVTIVTSLVGLGIGFYEATYYLESFTEGWFIPDGVEHIVNFVAVGSMHNFSYLGGMIGLIIGGIYSFRKRMIISKKNII